MIPLICALGLKIDFEMFGQNFYRAEVSAEETAFFINMQGSLYCIRTSLKSGVQKKKSFHIKFFESLPKENLLKTYNKLLGETPWVLL